MLPHTTIKIIGRGQLSRMLIESAAKYPSELM